MQMTTVRFRRIILGYYKKHKRNMPWRATRDPYLIVVSEVMLQQTQVARVVKLYPSFVRRFPDFRALGRAKTAVVLRAWQGMGYNRRALALRSLARIVLERFEGGLPRERAVLEALPGIGKATAGSIRAFAWNEPDVFIETNIRRVFIHFFFPRKTGVTDEEIKRYIKRTLPSRGAREWYSALMDYGAMLGQNARTIGNPNRRSADYRKQPGFEGSNRQFRGRMLRTLLVKNEISMGALSREIGAPLGRTEALVAAAVREGFVKTRGNAIIMTH